MQALRDYFSPLLPANLHSFHYHLLSLTLYKNILQIGSYWLFFFPDYLQWFKCIFSVQMHSTEVIPAYTLPMNISTTGLILRFCQRVLEVG